MVVIIKDLFKKYKNIILYLVFGVATTIVNWVVYTLCISVVNLSLWPSNIISWIACVLFAYFTNRNMVFASEAKNVKEKFFEFLKFIGSRLFTGILEIVGVPLMIRCGINQRIFNIEGMTAKVIIVVVIIILNYILSKCMVFSHRASNADNN